MGFWGSSLYANDTTSDVRDSYMNCLMDQMSDQEAYDKIIEKFADYLRHEDEEPLVWYALAETQWKVGRLLPEVKEKALYWIERKGGLEPWLDTPSKGKGWLKTLEKLYEKLNSPMPKRKNVRRLAPIDNNLWNINDIYAYQFHKQKAKEQGYAGKYMVIQKIGEGCPPHHDGLFMCVQIFDKLFDHLPTLEEMEGVRILPIDFPNRLKHDKDSFWMSAYWGVFQKSYYPNNHLTFLGNRKIVANNMVCEKLWSWAHIDWALIEFYDMWREVEYETIGDGIYRYLPKEADDNV